MKFRRRKNSIFQLKSQTYFELKIRFHLLFPLAFLIIIADGKRCLLQGLDLKNWNIEITFQ